MENFLRVLTGRIPASAPRSKRLLSDDRSNILIYMTGNCVSAPLIFFIVIARVYLDKVMPGFGSGQYRLNRNCLSLAAFMLK